MVHVEQGVGCWLTSAGKSGELKAGLLKSVLSREEHEEESVEVVESLVRKIDKGKDEEEPYLQHPNCGGRRSWLMGGQ